MENDPLEKLLNYILSELVSNPDEIRISRTKDEMGILYSINVHDSDYGKIIGKKGAIADAIRTILRSVGMNNHTKVSMVIASPVIE